MNEIVLLNAVAEQIESAKSISKAEKKEFAEAIRGYSNQIQYRYDKAVDQLRVYRDMKGDGKKSKAEETMEELHNISSAQLHVMAKQKGIKGYQEMPKSYLRAILLHIND